MPRSSSESCARIRDLGYRPFTRIAMYGERFEIVSDPFAIGSDVVVHVTSEKNPQMRILRLPISILVGPERSTSGKATAPAIEIGAPREKAN